MSRREQAAERAAIAFLLGERKLSIAEAASRLGKTERHVRRLLESGVISGKKIKDGRAVRKSWRVSSLDLPAPVASAWEQWAADVQEFIYEPEPTTYEDFMAVVPAALVRAQQKRCRVLAEPIKLGRQFDDIREPVKREMWGLLHRFPWPLTHGSLTRIATIREDARQWPRHFQLWTDSGRVHWLRASPIETTLRVPEITPWPPVLIEDELPAGLTPQERRARSLQTLTPQEVMQYLSAEAQCTRTRFWEDTAEQYRQLYAMSPRRARPLPRRPSSGWTDPTAY